MTGRRALMDRADSQRSPRRGFLNPGRVVSFSFWITTACILIAVVTSILAIWEFTGTDALWRTVATCVVVGVGTLAFSWINALFGMRD
jgi:NO-binding membrane sensor protein with MHYT domain